MPSSPSTARGCTNLRWSRRRSRQCGTRISNVRSPVALQLNFGSTFSIGTAWVSLKPDNSAGGFRADFSDSGTATKLGRARIDLAELEPMDLADLHLPIIPHKDAKVGKEQPVVHVRLLFRPAFLLRSRKSTSTFSAVGRVGTGVVGGVGAVGGGLVQVGGVVGKGAVQGVGTVGKGAAHGVGAVGKGVFGGIRRVTGSGPQARQVSLTSASDDTTPVPTIHATEELEVLDDATGAATPTQNAVIVTHGTLSITVESLSDVDDPSEKTFVAIRRDSKVVKETKAHHSDTNPILFGETAVIKVGDGPVDLAFTVM